MQNLTAQKNNSLLHSNEAILNNLEKTQIKKNLPIIFIGDMVKVGLLIKEGNKERVQYYQGIVIAKNNTGINLTISVRKVFQGIGTERKFLLHSPKFESIEIIKSSKVRRSKLYYLRNLLGKRSRLKQRFRKKK
uniref:50S ribosomal protein L19 n=1 Tax=Scytothamnus australis TaxID=66621 RepID=UPI002E789E7F|nr:50S ribosomal protein L19 [Scytothamnus australis]WAM64754.1 50S ribosomal protein L19 [Scytothamnus australis]